MTPPPPVADVAAEKRLSFPFSPFPSLPSQHGRIAHCYQYEPGWYGGEPGWGGDGAGMIGMSQDDTDRVRGVRKVVVEEEIFDHRKPDHGEGWLGSGFRLGYKVRGLGNGVRGLGIGGRGSRVGDRGLGLRPPDTCGHPRRYLGFLEVSGGPCDPWGPPDPIWGTRSVWRDFAPGTEGIQTPSGVSRGVEVSGGPVRPLRAFRRHLGYPEVSGGPVLPLRASRPHLKCPEVSGAPNPKPGPGGDPESFQTRPKVWSKGVRGGEHAALSFLVNGDLSLCSALLYFVENDIGLCRLVMNREMQVRRQTKCGEFLFYPGSCLFVSVVPCAL
jgi:hypothetical protein